MPKIMKTEKNIYHLHIQYDPTSQRSCSIPYVTFSIPITFPSLYIFTKFRSQVLVLFNALDNLCIVRNKIIYNIINK